jgi:cell division protein FtsZ
MPIELDTTTPIYDARIRVVGVGGGGGNAVRTMITRGLEGVEFIAANTDHQALMNNPAGIKIQLGKGETRGLGAGANPEVGRKAVEESMDDVRDALAGSDMIFVTAGMGGGTGTGAAPVIARIGREMGALVVAIVTKPFAYESKRRMQIADHGIKELREQVDALIVIPNQRILAIVEKNVPFIEALAKVDTVLYNATKGIADIISGVGYVNVDFADVRTVMSNMGDALMGIGTARGELRAIEAATNALNSPILEGSSIFGAQGLLVNVTGSSSMSMHEVSEAVSAIEKAAGDEVNLIHGVVIDESMEDEIAITVVATGFRRQEEKSKATSAVHSAESIAPARTISLQPAASPEAPVLPAQHVQPSAIVNTPSAPSPRETPRGTEELVRYDAPAILRRKEGEDQSGTASQSPQPSAHQWSHQTSVPLRAAAGGSRPKDDDRPSFLRRIMD